MNRDDQPPPYPVIAGYPYQQPGGYPQQAPMAAPYPPYPQQQPPYSQQQPPYNPYGPPQAAPYPGAMPAYNAGYPPQGGGMPGAQDYPKPGEYSNAADGFGASFSDKNIRRVFVRKVYSILMIQLAFTSAVIALFIFHDGTKNWIKAHSGLYFVAYIIFLVTYISLVCCKSVRRKYPTNIIMLSIFTAAMSFMVAMMSIQYKTEIVFMAFGTCTIICLTITIFSMQTKFDFTTCGVVLLICSVVLLVFGIVAMIFPGRTMTLIYSGLMALIFSLFLAYDTQMIMGGRKHELSPEEHISGALQLYLDVIYIFIAMLSIFGNSD